jgi:hypothetical protein
MQIDKYINEVIRPLLPNANLESWIQNNYHLFGHNQLLDSKYERKLTDNAYFIHFTSITRFLEIIRSKKIRLSDFNSFNDELELTYANNQLISNHNDFNDLKSNLFALSMCEDSEANFRNDYMWANYGRNHKGVCLRLKIDKSKSRFFNFHLGRIQYCENSRISELVELKRRHDEFKQKNNWCIDNLDGILSCITSMYKKTVPYSSENEVRLLAYVMKSTNAVHTNQNYPIRHRYDDDKNRILYFLELDLEYQNNEEDIYRLPHVSIDSVILV